MSTKSTKVDKTLSAAIDLRHTLRAPGYPVATVNSLLIGLKGFMCLAGSVMARHCAVSQNLNSLATKGTVTGTRISRSGTRRLNLSS